MKDKEKQKIAARNHYLANKERMKTKAKIWTKNQIVVNKKTIRDHLESHPCLDCGESNLMVLDFDHIRDKTIAVGEAVTRGWSTNKLLEEISKCEVRCANCHRIKTYERAGWTKYN